MGTNYYVEAQPPCEHCKRPYESKHVGKSSMGWKFLFNGTEFKTFGEWKKYLLEHDGLIKNEYGDNEPAEELINFIVSKSDGMNLAEYYEKYPEHRSPWNANHKEWEDGGCRFYDGEFS